MFNNLFYEYDGIVLRKIMNLSFFDKTIYNIEMFSQKGTIIISNPISDIRQNCDDIIS